MAKTGSAHPGAQEWVPPDADIEALRRAVGSCRGCDLYENATQAVFSKGPPSARVVLVGEQPGDQEDRKGEPFVGPAGRLLDKALLEAGIDPGEAYVTNAVKHFRFTQSGPGKRRIHKTPDASQLSACQPWLTAELALLEPDVLVTLGATAGKALMGSAFRVTKQRGVLIPLTERAEDEPTGHAGYLVATIHPSAVLRADDRDAAYAGFLADLEVAAQALG
jgi:uracil-DNA glycosylase family protein